MSYDAIKRDLCRKAADDVSASIQLTCALMDDVTDKSHVALFAAAGAMGAAAGFFAAILRKDGQEASSEALVDDLLERMRPIVISALEALPQRDGAR